MSREYHIGSIPLEANNIMLIIKISTCILILLLLEGILSVGVLLQLNIQWIQQKVNEAVHTFLPEERTES
jgi:hypothetical protein